MSSPPLRGALVAVLLLSAPPAARGAQVAELVGKPVVEVRLYRGGLVTDDPALLDLVETRLGQPLSIRQVRESVTHLYSLGEYADVRVSATEGPRGIALRYDLVPLRAALGVEVRGALGRPPEQLLDLVTRRFGRVVQPQLVPAVVAMLEAYYREAGRFAAHVTAETEGEDGRLMLTVDQGPAPRISRIELRGVSPDGRAVVLSRLDLDVGTRYDPVALERRLLEYETEIRARRYYEARFSHEVRPSEDGLTVELLLDVDAGAPVTIRFEQDPVPGARLDELVPVAREGSIDEDLLEDSSLRVESHLHALGFRDARVTHRRLVQPDELAIVFTVDRGARYQLAQIDLTGNRSLASPQLRILLGVAVGAPLVMADIESGVAAVTAEYARLGHRMVQVRPTIEPVSAGPASSEVVLVRLAVEVVEGQRTLVGSVVFEGVAAFDGAELAGVVAVGAGSPYYGPQLRADAAALTARYLNEGYETVQVDVVPRFDTLGATADVRFVVREGPQVLVDHVLVVGNRQISATAIRQELALRVGEPLGRDEVDETRRRLTALGLFRRIQLREFSHGGGNRRDVVIIVDEAPATRVGYGGGVEASQRLRATQTGTAAERLEFAPRGFVEVGRRNLWGRNRSIDLFARVSVRRKDGSDADMPRAGLGFNEYRVLLNYREPRAFRRSGDLFVSGFVEQAIRPSFDLFSRGVNAELRRALGRTMTGSVGYTYGVNRVTNEQLEPAEAPLVDRLFPEVTLSSFSSGLVRDTRDDPLEPTRGSLLGVEGELALRRLGSEVGFAKTTLQGFLFRRLPGDLVFAAGARLGLARGFPLSVPALPTLEFTDEGFLVLLEGEDAQDLPASERFFAGGDTTVRGFALDRLGDGSTIDANGFPTGGNAMIVVNTELRVPVVGPLQAVGFIDAGNVFDRVGNLDLGRLRGAAGFGVRYRSPVGPIRVDLGFKLDRRAFVGDRERLTALHLSIGQAF